MNHDISPAVVFDMMVAYQKSAALKGAVELRLFTLIGEGKQTPAQLAAACAASQRGVRILCDYLAAEGLLQKTGESYANTPTAAAFLDERSPAYMGAAVGFLNSTELLAHFDDIAGAVRHGGTVHDALGSIAPDHPIWMHFAESMAGISMGQASGVADIIAEGADGPIRVLDIAAGHGTFGVMALKKNPQARAVGLDWEDVLGVARRTAGRMGVADRYTTIAGSAFDVDLQGPYDVVLLPNFIHHFDVPACEQLLRRVKAALQPRGRVIIVEFVPNEDRVSPPVAATFSLVMLATTPAGDAYTFREIASMLRNTGFQNPTRRDLPHAVQHAIVATA